MKQLNTNILHKINLLFENYPKLAIIGGARGRDLSFKDSHCWGLNRKRIPYVDPMTKKRFMFVENINIGPYFMKKSAFIIKISFVCLTVIAT